MKGKKWKMQRGSAGSGAVYGLGLIGALIYFIQHASTASDFLFGLVKAVFWPAFFVYKALEVFKF